MASADRATATVEAAIGLMVMLTLLMMTLDIYERVRIETETANGARLAAELYTLNPVGNEPDCAQAETVLDLWHDRVLKLKGDVLLEAHVSLWVRKSAPNPPTMEWESLIYPSQAPLSCGTPPNTSNCKMDSAEELIMPPGDPDSWLPEYEAVVVAQVCACTETPLWGRVTEAGRWSWRAYTKPLRDRSDLPSKPC